MASRWYISFLLVHHILLHRTLAYDSLPRWGQAALEISDALLIFGGKTDQYNAYSYTSAPNNNDILYLSLSSAFSASSPPWKLLTSTNLSTSQGPALAWCSLSAFDASNILLFGGQPGPDSQTVVTDGTNSALTLNLSFLEELQWVSEPASWAGEPTRRMRHSTATALSGLVFIFGGEKVDLSNNAFSDHYVFDPTIPSFSLLPSNGGPPDLYGHTSILLSDQRILVFGGFSQSQGTLLPFSTIWVLDTTGPTFSWSTIETNANALPSPRMAFAAVLVSDEKIIIHGGTDSTFQSNFDDGWILDTTQNPMTWSSIDALSQLGARRDHFAISSGNQVIFGFGYGNNGPASALLKIFNPSDGTFSTTFLPPSPDTPATQTLPGPSQTTTKSTSSPHTTSGLHSSSTSGPTHTSTSSNNVTPIAVGATFGILSLIIVGLGTAYYIQRRHQSEGGDRRFMALGADDDDGRESLHLSGRIPVAGVHNEMGEVNGIRGILGTLGLTVATKMRTIRNPQHSRRDMLADEDTRSFGEWYNAREKDGSGGSSWSLMNVFGAGTPRLRSREASLGGHSSPRREKSDPFSDDVASMRDEETGLIGVRSMGSRTQARRYPSHTSTKSVVSYRDPFADPIEEQNRQSSLPSQFYSEYMNSDFITPTIRQVHPPSLPAINMILPLSNQPLSPVSEHTSRSTLALPDLSASGSSHGHSGDNAPSSSATISQATSLTSIQSPTPSSPTKSTFLIGVPDPAMLQSSQPIRRSDSWWSRFSRSSLLDRRGSDSGRTMLDIRDPNPAPKLGPIEEGSLHSDRSTPGSEEQSVTSAQRRNSQSHAANAYNVPGHGKSMSSLRTADSEAIERMAGTMDVVQRVKSRSSRWSSASRSSIGGLSIDTTASASEMGEGVTVFGDRPASGEGVAFVTSPVDMGLPANAYGSPPSSPPSAFKASFVYADPLLASGSSTPLSPGKVSERIQAYERRLSQDQTSPLLQNTKQREERTKKRVEVNYGLVQKPSLFVANPDNQPLAGSRDS